MWIICVLWTLYEGQKKSTHSTYEDSKLSTFSMEVGMTQWVMTRTFLVELIYELILGSIIIILTQQTCRCTSSIYLIGRHPINNLRHKVFWKCPCPNSVWYIWRNLHFCQFSIESKIPFGPSSIRLQIPKLKICSRQTLSLFGAPGRIACENSRIHFSHWVTKII